MNLVNPCDRECSPEIPRVVHAKRGNRKRFFDVTVRPKRDKDAEFLRRKARFLDEESKAASWPRNDQLKLDARRLRKVADRLAGKI